jgi:hypothetical protein
MFKGYFLVFLKKLFLRDGGLRVFAGLRVPWVTCFPGNAMARFHGIGPFFLLIFSLAQVGLIMCKVWEEFCIGDKGVRRYFSLRGLT